jgi:hypothetical protein
MKKTQIQKIYFSNQLWQLLRSNDAMMRLSEERGVILFTDFLLILLLLNT